MKGVLERERMLMRGKLAENLNSNRFRHDETDRNNTYVESKKRANMNEDRSDSESDDDEEESIWGRRQRSIHRNFNAI